jgi:hypothetical protein
MVDERALAERPIGCDGAASPEPIAIDDGPA